ncbi:MAG: cytochrome C oxidase subunit IV family protein [Ardenticatenaceae bacterium]|nr:cytochrome C oxidase subunit IV family protein [Anaerolineales bacterium]MCB8984927.1 cytochrome C oxidase subunit IV family protein [Ardenticatenaceae bacterium]MCB8987818.1 cytochrome C oxidase subunit IV family protein [Ardenticatenaceae bacterium]
MHNNYPSVRTYFLVFGALLLLLIATVGAHFVALGPFQPVVSLGIALLKALLIILFFMHVKASSGLVKLFAAAGFLWLLIFFLLTFGDFATRYWVPTLNQ